MIQESQRSNSDPVVVPDRSPAPGVAGLSERVAEVLASIRRGGKSLREVGLTLGINHETLRRMYTGQLPSAELLVRLCEEYGINGDWLLTGKPRRNPELFARREPEPVAKAGWTKPS